MAKKGSQVHSKKMTVKPHKTKRNKESTGFSTPFGLTQLSLKQAGTVCRELNMKLGPGKATVQVWRKNKKSTERRLIASQNKYTVSYRTECRFQKR